MEIAGMINRSKSMPSPAVDERRVAVGPSGREGILRLPRSPVGLVIFSHGAGSSRLSGRNAFVADRLARRCLASVLFDLLSEEEARHREKVFDVPLLGGRMAEAIRWAREKPDLAGLPIGLFGASTGSAAALVAAAQEPVAAIVSRGGRPELAGGALADVTAPVLLIVGEADETVLELNREAVHRLGGPCRLKIVPLATHLFEEPGALERVADLAADWFERHFMPAQEP
jgi:pimeloyl-ACP methyl ester carboxylesterase